MAKSKLKILMITLRSDASGGPRHVADLVEELNKKHSHEIDLYIASPFDPPFGSVFKTQARKHFILPHRGFSLGKLFALWRFVKKENIQIIHSHGRGAGVYSRLLGILTGSKVLHTFHGLPQIKSTIDQIKNIIELILAFFTDKMICVSPTEESRALKVAEPKKLVLIENGVSQKFINNSHGISKKQLSEKVTGSEPLNVGIFLRTDMVKGPDLFFKELSSNKNYYLNNQMIFLVAGLEKKDAYQYGYDDSLVFIQFQGTVDSMSFLNRIDILTSFSRSEGMPLTILEALACQVPCLISNIEAHRYFENCVGIFDFGDFQQKLANICANSELRAQKVSIGYELIQTKLNSAVMANKTMQLYGQLQIN